MSSLRYVVITPVRNEARYLPLAITSMCAQTIKPARWVLVNDGSTDQTAELIDQAAANHDWIESLHRKDRGCRQAGGGVIEAFNDGYKLVASADWEYLVKLDGDLSFEADYFEKCFNEFQRQPVLGIGGGICCEPDGDRTRPEYGYINNFHVRGATKIYRRACFLALGGLVAAPGWDTIDEIKANMLGWKTSSFEHIELVHHRPTGSAYGSWDNWVKNGLANYVTGYHPLFMALKCIRRLCRKPYLVQGIALWCGFMKGFLKGTPQVDDHAMVSYLRQQQWRALTFRGNLWD